MEAKFTVRKTHTITLTVDAEEFAVIYGLLARSTTPQIRETLEGLSEDGFDVSAARSVIENGRDIGLNLYQDMTPTAKEVLEKS